MNKLLIYILMALQCADGVLTYHGVSRDSIDMEGNPMLRYAMENVGVLPALLFFKVFGILILAYALTRLSSHSLFEAFLWLVGIAAYVVAVLGWIHYL